MAAKKHAIIIPLMGGLGNQLFQYAAGIHVQKFTNRHTYFSQSGLLLKTILTGIMKRLLLQGIGLC